jgi:hypothetical protein
MPAREQTQQDDSMPSATWAGQTAHSPAGAPGRLAVRARGLVVFVAGAALLTVARLLTPNPAGMGTHEQLHLPACAFEARTGYPCPSCGMTTAMAAMAQGDLALAWKAQPAGIALFLAVAALVAVGGVELVAGRDVWGRINFRWWHFLAIAAILLAGWGMKILSGLADGSLGQR